MTNFSVTVDLIFILSVLIITIENILKVSEHAYIQRCALFINLENWIEQDHFILWKHLYAFY